MSCTIYIYDYPCLTAIFVQDGAEVVEPSADQGDQPNSVLMTSAHSKIVEELKKVMPSAVEQVGY